MGLLPAPAPSPGLLGNRGRYQDWESEVLALYVWLNIHAFILHLKTQACLLVVTCSSVAALLPVEASGTPASAPARRERTQPASSPELSLWSARPSQTHRPLRPWQSLCETHRPRQSAGGGPRAQSGRPGLPPPALLETSRSTCFCKLDRIWKK